MSCACRAELLFFFIGAGMVLVVEPMLQNGDAPLTNQASNGVALQLGWNRRNGQGCGGGVDRINKALQGRAVNRCIVIAPPEFNSDAGLPAGVKFGIKLLPDQVGHVLV
ncbi:MAG: hypothetical protein HOK61_09690 [Alphaproteobacteria bacterium]|nr:hypothetical protein [Alphaproteobacteria bacterium]